MAKLGVATVGEFVVRRFGQISVQGWQFVLPPDMADRIGSMEIPETAEGIAGWTWAELHEIAHGEPCECAIGQALYNVRSR